MASLTILLLWELVRFLRIFWRAALRFQKTSSTGRRTVGKTYFKASKVLPIGNLSLLTVLGYETQNEFPSGISQFSEEALADSSPSQIPPHFSATNSHESSPTSSLGTFPDQNPACSAKSTSVASTEHSFARSPSSADSISISVGVSNGKKQIPVAATTITCARCTRSFSTASRYRHTTDGHNCQSPFECPHCRKPIKHLKSLSRHLGLDGGAAACLELKKAAAFHPKELACTCSSKQFTRRDTLIRHLRNKAGDTKQEHRCRACDNSPCKCV
ncbi:hypothetical protein BKA63DRAFT_489932 [Paraphoma chrysanthemicola]|nr:hypothetical protein BKA63DRAFT_489932 [Paraphoma chrysanthemicola]